MKLVALLGAKRQGEQKNLKSFLVLSASIRIRKCLCHTEDHQTVNNTRCQPRPVHNPTKTRKTAMKQCESEQNDKTMVQYDETMVQYDETKHSL
jgi:hypothetical protein